MYDSEISLLDSLRASGWQPTRKRPRQPEGSQVRLAWLNIDRHLQVVGSSNAVGTVWELGLD
jgi:hypothetical protein